MPLKGIRTADALSKAIICIHCQHVFHPTVNLACPQCRKPLRVRMDYLGKQIVCKSCQHSFRAEWESILAGQSASATAKPAPVAFTDPGQERIAALETEVNQLRAELVERDLLRQKVQALEVRSERVTALEQELTASHADADELRVQLARCKEQAGVVYHQGLELAKRSLEALRYERDQLAQKLEDLQAKSEQSLQYAQAQWECERRTREVQLEQQFNEERTIAVTEREQRQETQKQLDMERADWQHELERFREQQEASLRQFEALAKERTKQHQETMAQLRQDLQSVQSERDQFHEEVRGLQEQVTAVKRLENDLHAQRTEAGRLQVEVEAFRSHGLEPQSLAASMQELRALREQRDQLTGQVGTLQAQLDQLRGEHKEATAAEERLNARVKELEQKFSDTRARYAEELVRLTRESEVHSKEPDQASAGVERTSEVEQLRRERDEGLRTIEALTQKCDQLRATLEEAESQLIGQESQSAETVEKPHDAHAKRFLELANEVQRLRSELADQKGRAAMPTAAAKKGSGLLKAVGWWRPGSEEHDHTELEGRLENLRKQALNERDRVIRKAAEMENADLQRQLDEALGRLQEANERAERLEAELVAASGQIRREDGAHGSHWYEPAHEKPYGAPFSTSEAGPSGRGAADR
jgi:chromosome segregation ATPase